MSRPEALPGWLRDRFPARASLDDWPSLRLAPLRVAQGEGGAGLSLEFAWDGVRIDGVDASPGQDPAVRAGAVVIAVDGQPLLGLEGEQAVEARFAEAFRDGALLLLADGGELRAAVVEQESNEECPCEAPDAEEPEAPPETLANYELLHRAKSSTEYDATVRIPVGRGTVWSLASDSMALLREDLRTCGERFNLSIEAKLNRDGHVECVVLSGLSSAIADARPEVVQILQFYREGPWSGADPRADLAGRPQGAAAEEGAAQLLPEGVQDLRQFMYHDHTADIIVHSWGRSRGEAFAQLVVGMFQYMTDLDLVDVHCTVDVEAKGHDLLDLLYHLLDEFLFVFGTEMHVSRHVQILEFDEVALRIRARGFGEKMNLKKHEQGTEIKAITMHMMKVIGPDGMITEGGTVPREEDAESSRRLQEGFAHEAYVLLDI